ncbi:MAG: hypothetical protein IT376_03980 [Polyangiaceae bacterium]|nr:hypothetical protein [Polyangiaceae bacterium]
MALPTLARQLVPFVVAASVLASCLSRATTPEPESADDFDRQGWATTQSGSGESADGAYYGAGTPPEPERTPASPRPGGHEPYRAPSPTR